VQDGTWVIRLVGAWRLTRAVLSSTDIQGEVAAQALPRRIAFDARDLTGWDRSILTFLIRLSEFCRERGISMDREGLPAGVRKLLDLAEAMPERRAREETSRKPHG
jgi:phospholipid/cholesterol/gamma-HCH transport system permease protein